LLSGFGNWEPEYLGSGYPGLASFPNILSNVKDVIGLVMMVVLLLKQIVVISD